MNAYMALTEMRQEHSREDMPGGTGDEEVIVPRTVGMPESTAFERLNKIDWGISAPHWLGILTREGNRVVTGTTAIALGTDFAVYLAGGMPDKDKQRELIGRITSLEENSDYQLPPPIA